MHTSAKVGAFVSDKGKCLYADLAAFTKFPKLGCRMINLGDRASAAMMVLGGHGESRPYGHDLIATRAMSEPSLQAQLCL